MADAPGPGREPPPLSDYWIRGKGAALIGWGTPGDFDRCVAEMTRYVGPAMAKGTCANMHKRALGVWPGQEHA